MDQLAQPEPEKEKKEKETFFGANIGPPRIEMLLACLVSLALLRVMHLHYCCCCSCC